MEWVFDASVTMAWCFDDEHTAETDALLRRLFDDFARMAGGALNMLTGFSTLPLQAASVLGFVLTAFGLFLLVIIIARYLIQGVIIPGFTFLASVIVIFSGAQLFTLGVIGEYLARMHFRIMRQPSYAVRRAVGTGEQACR